MPFTDFFLRGCSFAGRLLSRFQGAPLVSQVERGASRFHRGLNNEHFDMARNGELRVLQALQVLEPSCLVDVGANVGEWSRLAAGLFPAADIHAFEVVPSTYHELSANVADLPRVRPNNFGLSDRAGEIDIFLAEHGSSDATAFRIKGLADHDLHYASRIRGKVVKGAEYLSESNITRVDFMKIDVEGMDLRVIKGFGDRIRSVRALQFEYGVFNIASHDLLADFCEHLQSYGFVVGKVYANSVKFFDYHFRMENFYGCNYVAVGRNEDALVRELS